MTMLHVALMAAFAFAAGWRLGHWRYKREVKAMAGTLDRLAVTGVIKQ